jgi:hypothetical protein
MRAVRREVEDHRRCHDVAPKGEPQGRVHVTAADTLEHLLTAEWDYRADPDGWVRDVLGEHLWSRQRTIMRAVRDHRRVGV